MMKEAIQMELTDLQITQKNVNDFLNEIHVDALVDSIKMTLNTESEAK